MIKYDNKIDLKSFRRLLKQAEGFEITALANDKQLQTAIDNSMYISTAIENDEVIGLARVVGDNSLKGMLCDVIVLKDYQNQGIGRKIIENIKLMIENDLEEKEQFLLELCPVKETIKFYESCGFKYDSDDMIGMSYRFMK